MLHRKTWLVKTSRTFQVAKRASKGAPNISRYKFSWTIPPVPSAFPSPHLLWQKSQGMPPSSQAFTGTHSHMPQPCTAQVQGLQGPAPLRGTRQSHAGHGEARVIQPGHGFSTSADLKKQDWPQKKHQGDSQTVGTPLHVQDACWNMLECSILSILNIRAQPIDRPLKAGA